MGLPGKFVCRASLLTAAILALASYPAKWWLGEHALRSLVIGGVVSAAVVCASFSALVWSFDKSNRTFMATYAVGFLGRMLILSGAILIIHMIDGLNLIAGSLAILFVYLSLTAMEIVYVNAYRSSR